MAIEYKGEETLYVVEIDISEDPETPSVSIIRPFNQTGGSTNIAADAIELSTKDKSGSDYGNVTQEVSLEGIITEGDPFVKAIKRAIRNKELVKIYEVNTRTNEAEHGMYMISAFDRDFAHGEFATYSLTGTLNGDVTEEELEPIPEGAPTTEQGNGGGSGVEG